jgi:hypothetical protein
LFPRITATSGTRDRCQDTPDENRSPRGERREKKFGVNVPILRGEISKAQNRSPEFFPEEMRDRHRTIFRAASDHPGFDYQMSLR